ncbi:hypothetical protein [Nonomuraea sp. CA-141351]|uniref:hypothetical protein n=1 Tax=Nonomuraea sp. CA-141351 TaxID=3239996 RepID=UPI003D933725
MRFGLLEGEPGQLGDLVRRGHHRAGLRRQPAAETTLITGSPSSVTKQALST